MDRNDTIYILHKTGAKNHHIGLEYLLRQHNGRLVFREFSIAGTFFKSLIRFDLKSMAKQIVNLLFLLNLLFTKNKRVVLGIAPFDRKLTMLLAVLKNHIVFYHTSWTVWDGSHHPKRKNVTPAVMQRWKQFLERDSRHIFAVSHESKIQLQANYEITDDRISVVRHAFDAKTFNSAGRKETQSEPLQFLYVGRLVKQKGLVEVLEIFSKSPGRKLTIIGSGELQGLVEDFAKNYDNISFIGYVSDPKTLAGYYHNHHYLILNSHRTGKWEEVFGIVLIEAMACGVVPISTNHSGPREIIDGRNGYLIEEGTVGLVLENLDDSAYHEMQRHAIETASRFTESSIAQRWLPVFND